MASLFLANPVYGYLDDTVKYNQPEWLELCQRFRDVEFAKEPEMDVTYSAPPLIKALPDFWWFDWQGIKIPVPALKYDEIVVGRLIDGRNEVMLIDRKSKTFIMLGLFTGFYSDNLFAGMLKNDNTFVSKADGLALTKTIMGGGLSTLECTIAGYKMKPSILKCEDTTRLEDAKNFYFLTLKRVGRSSLKTAHEGVGRYQGAIEIHEELIEGIKRTEAVANFAIKGKRDLQFQVAYVNKDASEVDAKV